MTDDLVTSGPSHAQSRGKGMRQMLLPIGIALCVVTVAAVVYVSLKRSDERAAPPAYDSAAPDAKSATAPAAPVQAAVAPEPAVAPELPPVAQSDSFIREAFVDWFGDAGVRIFQSSELARRIVATVDNLTRAKVPVSVLPFRPVDGTFLVEHTTDGPAIGALNFERYKPYVALVEHVDSKALVAFYRHYYGWFQETYRMLGYPTGNFHQRLLASIDDLLNAPDPRGPILLVQPKVLYEFADADLEELSAGQKMMIRMGPENRRVVAQKLQEIRRELVQPSQIP